MAQVVNVRVTVAGGLVTAVTVTTAGTGYTFGTVSNAQIIAKGSTNLAGSRIRCYHRS